MIVEPTQIDEFFDEYGWSFEKEEDTLIWRTGWRGDVSTFNLTVKMTEHWLLFVVNPFVSNLKESCRDRVTHRLARLNFEMTMAKAFLDEDNDIGMAIELPRENFTLSHFQDALGALTHYADKYYLEVMNMAHAPVIG